MGSVVVGDLFRSFAELQSQISQYERKNHVQLNLRDTRTLENARKRAPNRVQGSNMELRYYCVHYACVCGGKRYQGKGRGARPCQRTIKKDCKAGIKLSLSDNKQCLVVTEVNEVHNHPMSPGIYSHLPKQRRLAVAEKAEVEAMISLGVNRKLLQLHVQQVTGKAVTLKDLSNVSSQWKDKFTKNDLSGVAGELQEVEGRMSRV